MTSIIGRVSEQSLNVTLATPEITTKQQQASNNSLLASLLNNIIIKPFKHVVFYLAGLAQAGIFILFIACVNVNTWGERAPPSAADGLTSVLNGSDSRWLVSMAPMSHAGC